MNTTTSQVTRKTAMALLLVAHLQYGCVTEPLMGANQWYQGVDQAARQACRQRPPTGADECLSRLQSMDYDRYTSARQQDPVTRP